MNSTRSLLTGTVLGGLALLAGGSPVAADDFPPFNEVSKGYQEVRSTMDESHFFHVWLREKDNQMLAELPRGFNRQKHFFAMAQPGGNMFAGLQSGMRYVYWRRYDKRMALIQPNLSVRAKGEKEAQDSVKQLFTDRVLVDVPIVAIGPHGQPVIDLDELLVKRAGTFYGGYANGLNPRLAHITSAKVFPGNIEIEFEAPVAGGRLNTFHYSISLAPQNTGYKPRVADDRVGYFTTTYRDLSKYQRDDVDIRYINRWHLEKADPKLKLSPPKEPIVFYLSHTIPVRYRRWVKAGILEWNKAFEQVGISDAIVVYTQDASTGANMDKQPEDVRYNFVLWLNNDVGLAIGPSRVDPNNGQILDADIILTDGWIRVFWYQANELLPKIVMENFGTETLNWLREHPEWDPRVLLASPEDRPEIKAKIAAGDDMLPRENDHACLAEYALAMDMSIMSLYLEDADKQGKDDGQKLDGIPEWFVGPMLKTLVTHEVGHTLGLRHNFKASSIYKFDEINSEAVKGKKPFAGSVMDYNPVNINMKKDDIQGDYANIGIGPYDKWAIEYGYTFGDTKEVLKRVADPKLVYATDEDTRGPDPLARAYDFAADPLTYAENLMDLVRYHRARILSDFVKDGDSWARARRAYGITLRTQANAISIMSNWLGGTFVNRDHKGDPDARPPHQPVPAEQQRAALQFVIDNAFKDEAYGLTPELLTHLATEKWGSSADSTYAVHDSIMGLQGSAMTQIINPTTLRRIYDNEVTVPADQDMITIPEVLSTVRKATWSELDKPVDGPFSERQPMISSLRRDLQREYLDRMISLATGHSWNSASGQTIASLMTLELDDLKGQIDGILESQADALDRYTLAHLTESSNRIGEALQARYIRGN